MSDLAQRLAGLSPAQRKLLERRLTRASSPQPAAAEPIAIVGMACRFPGAPDLDAYWELIRDCRSAVGEVPAERWSAEEFFEPTGEMPGKMSVRWAALIDDPDQFDPQFFGITPREAARMDPQQRLLLEVAWEAMENAGRPADTMAGSRTGVFVGIGGTDYSKVCVPYDSYWEQIDAHMGTGNALSIAANRLSYIFDFHGPSAAVDTACSSSSLAIHFAVESLRREESDAALAGGVNMILTPETTIAFSKARMLSPEGVCRPFDARANGYVRGEGCGLVLLKRLADAVRDGDRVFGVLRGTSVNQDGRTSGISAPNSQSQMACIRAALAQAAMTPDDIGYVEAHGTGTPLGDPIEMQALSEIFRKAQGADGPPCYVSSVKANVGHMETVSGVAGLIKVLLMMQHERIAPQTHFESLNPHINLSGTRLVVPAEPVKWPRGATPRTAGISSFGFGGTNTHLVVQWTEADCGLRISDCGLRDTTNPQSEIRNPKSIDRPWHVLKLSAKSEPALVQQAGKLATYLAEHPNVAAADVCYSANTGRADFHHRATVIAKDAIQLRERLEKLSGEVASVAGKATANTPGIKRAQVRALGRPKVAFLCTGQGLQYPGMGRRLYESQPLFRDAIDRSDAVLRRIWNGTSLIDVLFPVAEAASPDDAGALIHQTQYTQPALFALEIALAELWRSWGVEPDIVLGHSVGEYAAACIADVMSLEDGLALIAERARLMQGVRRPGRMAVIFASAERVAAQIADARGALVIAVNNGPENTVISGDAAAVERLAAQFETAGVQVKLLNVSHAFHSPLMDEMLDDFERFAGGIKYHAPRVPMAANLTGQLMAGAPTARYWRDHLRSTVQFAEGMARVAEANPAVILEIGPTASLLSMGRRCVPQLDAGWLASLRQGQDDWQTITASVSEYYLRGGQVDWRGWDRAWRRERLLLPTYPFQRSRHWFTLDPSQRRTFGEAASAAGMAAGASNSHPLLGARLSIVWTNMLFETRFSAQSPAYLADHQVQGSAVTPAAVYVEQGLAAADEQFGPGRHGLADVVIQQAMFLPEGVRRRVEVSVAPESGGESTFETYSRPADDGANATSWTMHATGRLVHETNDGEQLARIDLAAVRERAVGITSQRDFYELMSERGLAYGPAFQALDELHRGALDATAKVVLSDAIVREASCYHLHPAVGDALLQSMAGAVPLDEDGSFSPFTYMPVGIRRVRMRAAIDDYSQPLFSYAVRTSTESGPSPEHVEGNVYLVNATGEVLVALEGVQIHRLGRSGARDTAVDTGNCLYRIAWRENALAREAAKPAAPTTGAWLIFADAGGVGRQLADKLAERGEATVLVEAGAALKLNLSNVGNGQPRKAGTATVDPLDESHIRQLIDTAFVGRKLVCRGVVHLWSLDIPDFTERGVAPPSRRRGCGSVLQLIRVLASADLPQAPPLWLVTAGATAVDDSSPVAVEQSPLVGLGRAAAMELPDFRPRLVDLDPAGLTRHAGIAADALFNEVVNNTTENEVAYRNGKRFVARLIRDPSLVEDASDRTTSTLTVPAGRPFQLRITQAGSFDALRLMPVDRQPPGVGQVEIAVLAAGLNFSDVLKALGLYPGIRDAIVPLGIEASGVVTAVGEGVERFKVGDEVCGVVPYAFASHARTAEYALVHKPKSIGHDEACTIPITFLTAYYGLVRLAQLQPGERVLIHAGAGGVGLAAIQIAQQIGAEIYVTAGSDAKRDFLRSLGVRHVYSSRSTAFADEILADTDRQGVDVVLNSLPGEAITKSLSILRAYGRFLEIGKTDIYQNRMIGLLPFQDNLSYFAIDLDRMLRQRPEYIRSLFAEVMDHFAAGHYRPLMLTRFEAEQTVDAFRYMSQRKNIGKVVVAMESPIADSSGQSEIRNPKSEIVRRDGTYLITGGLGALGLRVARWLAEQGAGTIALLSRRSSSADAEPAVAAIRQRGARVVVLSGDVADPDSLSSALGQIPADAPPLRGVVHAAGVLADGVLADMTLDQLDRAMTPKVQGAWNLHSGTLEAPLDFFVMFSSVASLLGSPGQGNYAAGNAFLDALAHARRAQGLPAMTINWGPWAESGMAVEAGRGDGVKSRGMELIPPEKGLELLGKLLRSGATQVAVMDAKWADMLRLLGSRRPALLSDLAAEVETAGGQIAASRVDHEFRSRLIAADADTRQALVSEYIRSELARIIGVEPATLEPDQPLNTYGLDSLLALELKNNLEGRLDFTLPMAKLMEGPSIVSLAAETVRLVVGGAEGSDEAPTTAEAASPQNEAWTPLLALRRDGSRPPLVLLPALGGDVRCYAELVQQLGDSQPVYAIRPRGVDQDLPPHLTMKEMITDYEAALRQLQPAGPYHLAGWSTGGIFAFALAEALERSGDDVDLLALFDTPLPSICEGIDVEDDARFLCSLVNFVNRFAGTSVRVDYDDLLALPTDERFPAALAEARRERLIPVDTPEAFVRRLVHVGESNVRVVQSYQARPLRCRVRLFVPEVKGGLAEVSGHEMPSDEDHGWSAVVGQDIELHTVVGDHFTMMVDSASVLAQNLSQLIGQVPDPGLKPRRGESRQRATTNR